MLNRRLSAEKDRTPKTPQQPENSDPIATGNRSLDDPSLYLNREISWLAFNERVLSEALSTSWPLLERLKFLAIFSSNLDEFFMIRVSGLHEQLEAAVVETSPDGLSAGEQLERIAGILRGQLHTAAELLADDLFPALAAQGIHIRDWSRLTQSARGWGDSTFASRSSRC